MARLEPPAALTDTTRRIETDERLDGPVAALEPHVARLFASGTRGTVLRGDWLGHSLHTPLTELVLGSWTSATVLDVVGRGRWSDAARVLVGTGLVAFGPAAWSGWAQWSAAGPETKRVGLVHAVVNATAVGLYAGSWVARRRGRGGVGLALTGMAVSRAAAYLGGHMAHPAERA